MTEDEWGRRNWMRCCAVQDVTSSRHTLFPGGQFSYAVLSGLAEVQEYPTNPVVQAAIDALLLQQKEGLDVEIALDKQLIISLLPPHIQQLCLDRISIPDSFLLHSDAVDDIGHIIRDIMVQKNNNDVLFKLYQYTMPFIKHNRLNFPPRRMVSKTLLKHLLQIMAITCLGLHSTKSKKPIWHMRRKIFKVFTNLQTQGSLADIYLFCQQHNYIVRLALMENFVHFTAKHMSMEMQFVRNLLCTGYEHTKVGRLVCYITDNFRTSALQNETLDWELIESKAQIAIERCNRTCKSHTVQLVRRVHSVHNCVDAEAFAKLLSFPVLSRASLLLSVQQSDMLTMALRWKLNAHVSKYALPVRMQLKQFTEMQDHTHNSYGTIANRSLLHVCLRCAQQHIATSNNMRIDFLQRPMCVRCDSHDFVITADILGHLVRVFSQYYYFCTSCMKVHPWRGTGAEFFTCAHTPCEPRRKHCIICFRTMQLTAKTFFDKRIGVMQSFYLCSKHCPPVAQTAFAYDLASLRRLIEHVSK